MGLYSNKLTVRLAYAPSIDKCNYED